MSLFIQKPLLDRDVTKMSEKFQEVVDDLFPSVGRIAAIFAPEC